MISVNEVYLEDEKAKEEALKWETPHSPDEKSGFVTFIHPVSGNKGEIFWLGSTVIWQNEDSIHKVIRVDGQVEECFTAQFHAYPGRPSVVLQPQDQRDEEVLGSSHFAVCIRQHDHGNGGLRIFYEDGREFLLALPFPVKRSFSLKYGVLFESVHEGVDDEPFLPPWFCLLHPLEDFTRFVLKNHDSVGNEPPQIVMASDKLCLTFDNTKKFHSLWRIRPATAEESAEVEQRVQNTAISDTTMDRAASSSHHHHRRHKTPFFSLQRRVTSAGNSPLSTRASISRSPATVGTSSAAQKRFSAVGNQSIGNSFIANSPRASLHRSVLLHNVSSTPFTPFDQLRSQLQSQSDTLGGDGPHKQSQESTVSLDIFLCLDLVWQEPRDCSTGCAVLKSFCLKNSFGESQLCLFQERLSRLVIHPFQVDPIDGTFRFSTFKMVDNVCDAAPLTKHNVILVLEETSGQVCLISGSKRLGRVLFTSAMTSGELVNEISALNLDSCNTTNIPNSQVNTPITVNRVSRFAATPLPVTSSRPPSATDPLNESLGLSPVVAAPSTDSTHQPPAKVQAIVKCVSDMVTLQLTSGKLIVARIPYLDKICSPFVLKCLRAVVSNLRDMGRCDLAEELYASWFATRTAPGPSSVAVITEWKMFTRCLLGLMGYRPELFSLDGVGTTSSTLNSSSPTPSASLPLKKQRKSVMGSDRDWEALLGSHLHLEGGNAASTLMGLESVTKAPQIEPPRRSVDSDSDCVARNELIDAQAILFSSIPCIVKQLHLLYEEFKLDRNTSDCLPHLAKLLSRLCADLQLEAFVKHFWVDFPAVCSASLDEASTGQIEEYKLKMLQTTIESELSSLPNIHDHLRKISQGKASGPGHFSSNPRAKYLILCYQLAFQSLNKLDLQIYDKRDPHIDWLANTIERISAERDDLKMLQDAILVKFWVHLGFSDNVQMKSFPVQLLLPILRAATGCKIKPDILAFGAEECKFIGREDISCQRESDSFPASQNEYSSPWNKVVDGMEEIESSDICKLRWPKDRRLRDARLMLQSASPVPITVVQRPEVSDHDFIEEQERSLFLICMRTMALSVGRGGLTLFTSCPLETEPLTIPKLCLTGRAPPRGTHVEMDHIEVAPNMERWPLFHNGVATGLKISKRAKHIDSAWITFNKPREPTQNQHQHQSQASQNQAVEHAGLLFGLGLGGHLSKLGKLESFDYLMKGHEITSIGVLLGAAASKRGTMDIVATKKVATQLAALLPPAATELPLSQSTQIAALMSLGLLYQGTGHRHMAEVCLSELGRPPGPELENCADRESYSLTAGLALGMITFGQGREFNQGPLADLYLSDILYYHMVGGPRSALGDRLAANRYTHQSFQVKEGDTMNIDVTGPGATLALGMMYFNTGNVKIADWMLAPATQHLLEFVRPDFLTLRAIARGLILWDEILPSMSWVEEQIPEAIRPYCLVRPSPETHPPGLDYETLNQAYCNIIAGAGLILGIRFAGTQNKEAFEVLYALVRKLIRVSKRSVAELAGRATVEHAICACTIAVSVVMAGTGDLDVLRLIRYLRSRVGSKHSVIATYGSHLAISMSLGILFLGGGSLTLGTEPMDIAAMIAAFYPKFPTHSNANRYHLQAFRHLYVLAAKPMLLTPRDLKTGEYAYTNLQATYAATKWYPETKISLVAPATLPDLSLLREVRLTDDRYHEITFSGGEGIQSLKNILNEFGGILPVKLRTQFVSSSREPKGIFNKMLNFFSWRANNQGSTVSERKLLLQKYEPFSMALLDDCARRERLDLISFWVEEEQIKYLSPMRVARSDLAHDIVEDEEPFHTAHSDVEIDKIVQRTGELTFEKTEWKSDQKRVNCANERTLACHEAALAMRLKLKKLKSNQSNF